MAVRTGFRASREKVRAHRQRLRAQGLRPIQIRAPDMRAVAYVAEAYRQALAVTRSPDAREDQEFIDAIADGGGK